MTTMSTGSNDICGVGVHVTLALWGLLVASTTPALTAVAAEPPSPSDILTRYAENRDKIESFAITVELRSRGDSSWVKRKMDKPRHTISTLSSDGERIAIRRTSWGPTVRGTTIPKEDPLYASGLWDGELHYQYNQAEPNPYVVITRPNNDAEKEQLVSERGIVQSPAAPSLGHLALNCDRVDKALQEARNISVRPETERVGDWDCYVVEAETDSGTYKVWFDPDHGYSIAKAVVDRNEGDKDVTRTLGKDMVAQYTYEMVRFEKYGDAWIPVEGKETNYQTWGKSLFSSGTSDWKIMEMQLDPDHEVLGSFRTDDIREGSKVFLTWAPGIEYRWEDGGYKGRVDQENLETLVHEVTQIKAETDTDAVPADGVQKAIHVEQAEVADADEKQGPSGATVEPLARTPATPRVSQAETKPSYWPAIVGVVVLLILAVLIGYRRVRYV